MARSVDARRGSVTRDDVARYAGVSAAVVSYVVNSGPRRVAPETRDRVLEAIRVLGYSPNTFARALKVGSTKTLGLVVPDIGNPLFLQMAMVLEQAASTRGYALLLTNSAGDRDLETRQLQNLVDRRVDGIIMITPSAAPDLSSVLAADVPLVLLNGSTRDSDVSNSVRVDLAEGARKGVEHLIWHGHQTIGLIMGDSGQRSAIDRERGWLEALHDAGLREGPTIRAPFTREGGYNAGKRLLRSAASPTAVFVSSDMQAVGVLRALHEAGVAIPDDMAIVSFDGSPEAEYSWPPLTSVQQPIHDLAEATITDLLAGRADAAEEPHRLVLPGELTIRSSCGCPPVA